MDSLSPLLLYRRIAAVVLVVVVVVSGVAAWTYSGAVRDQLLAYRDAEIEPTIEVVAAGDGRIELERTAASERPGVWGVFNESGYGQISVVVSQNEETVKRAIRQVSGEFVAGDLVAIDSNVFSGDPSTAHGLEFQEVRFGGELGAYSAWVIAGDSDTWVILVPGEAPGGRQQTLRTIPALVGAGYSVMSMSVRGDIEAPATSNGLRSFGVAEWQDLSAAINFALSRDAHDVVLFGLDAGATVVSAYLNLAEDISNVRGVVLDSALLDPERIADRIASQRRVYGPLHRIGKLLVTLRFDIDWAEVDQVARAEEYTVPVLLMHGTEDAVADVEVAREFAERASEFVRYEEFEDGTHSQLWNADPARYDQVVIDFIDQLPVNEG